jgi:hypothetical protein
MGQNIPMNPYLAADLAVVFHLEAREAEAREDELEANRLNVIASELRVRALSDSPSERHVVCRKYNTGAFGRRVGLRAR